MQSLTRQVDEGEERKRQGKVDEEDDRVRDGDERRQGMRLVFAGCQELQRQQSFVFTAFRRCADGFESFLIVYTGVLGVQCRENH